MRVVFPLLSKPTTKIRTVNFSIPNADASVLKRPMVATADSKQLQSAHPISDKVYLLPVYRSSLSPQRIDRLLAVRPAQSRRFWLGERYLSMLML